MTPGSLDLLMPKGSTFQRTLTWKINGSAVNLTGYTARMQARESHTAASTVLNLTSGSGITLGGTAGTIAISVSATTTAAITQSQLVYDLELVAGDGTVTRLVEGVITLTPEVTR